MATDNSNNNTTLDIALEELLNNTEFRQQYDTTYVRPTTTEIETTGSGNTIHAHENVSSTETTPNSLNIAHLHESQAHEKESSIRSCQSQSQTTKEVYSSLDDIVEIITIHDSEIIPPSTSMEQTKFPTPMKASTGIHPMTSPLISTVTQSPNTPFMQSIGTMPITPTGYKSIGTLPMTPPGSKTTGTMTDPPISTPADNLQPNLQSTTIHADISNHGSTAIALTIQLNSSKSPTETQHVS
ncbi:unnamed protein product [Adineta ricciae]|uniref:Uncharacterized protein n=1 Tax=Adineta ricciae TaxID=249248 RepID=A0A815QH43_ADIRI|nr:unnamed protein product [Adineta ricciae]CAF1535013.1 unnamed protein product [Adineta ricciae]